MPLTLPLTLPSEPTRASTAAPPARARLHLESSDPARRYQAWVLQHAPSAETLARQRLAARRMAAPPLISIVTPVYDTPPELLRRMLASVRRQSYPFWELCFVDDGSPSVVTQRALARLTAGDPRIRVTRRDRNGGIVAASNDALAQATGPFVALMDHDDEIAPHALYEVARALEARPDADVVYSDLDILSQQGVRIQPLWFPDWSPEYLLAVPYIVHLSVFRRTLLQDIGGFRVGFDGSQDYDLALRVSRETDRFVHIHDVLYHWRAWSGSAAMNPATKPYAYDAGLRAIQDHLRHLPLDGRREPGPGLGLHTCRFAIAGAPLVSVIAPIGCGGFADEPDGDGASPGCGDGIGAAAGLRDPERAVPVLARLLEASAHRAIECLLVVPPELEARTAAALAATGDGPLRAHTRLVVTPEARHDVAPAVNQGAAAARGEYLLIISELLAPANGEWLQALLEYAQRPGIGAVGPRILSPRGPVWSAGLVVPRAVPLHARWEALVTRNCSAMSGACLLTRRASFDAVGGLRPARDAGCSDADYGLRLRARGERLVLMPTACVVALDELPAAFGPRRREAFAREWGRRVTFDPYYNRNLCQDERLFMIDLD